MESGNARRKEDQTRYRGLPNRPQKRERDDDSVLQPRENRRATDANAERREKTMLERKSEAEHSKDGSEERRDSTPALASRRESTPSLTARRESTPAPAKERKTSVEATPRDEQRGRMYDDRGYTDGRGYTRGRSAGSAPLERERAWDKVRKDQAADNNRRDQAAASYTTDNRNRGNSRTNSHVRRDFPFGKPRERTPQGNQRWPENGDNAREIQHERERTQQNRDALY